MMRDLTMILSVLVAVASLGFGVYKNIEAGNARGFAYEQAYRIIGQIQEANISQAAKQQLTEGAMNSIGAPAGVLDVGRSSAGVAAPSACTVQEQSACTAAAAALGAANIACAKAKGIGSDCARLADLRQQATACIKCFVQ